jgi:hypothetical protein
MAAKLRVKFPHINRIPTKKKKKKEEERKKEKGKVKGFSIKTKSLKTMIFKLASYMWTKILQ